MSAAFTLPTENPTAGARAYHEQKVIADEQWKAIQGGNAATRAIKRDELPEDLVGAMLFLCSSDSDFVTGQTMVVDEGSVMH